MAEGKDDYLDMVEFYTMQNVFYLPETSRWSYIQQHAKQGDIAIKIDLGSPGGQEPGGFNTFMTTPPISLAGLSANTAVLSFDSSWRPEFDDNYHQSGNATVTFDGGDRS